MNCVALKVIQFTRHSFYVKISNSCTSAPLQVYFQFKSKTVTENKTYTVNQRQFTIYNYLQQKLNKVNIQIRFENGKQEFVVKYPIDPIAYIIIGFGVVVLLTILLKLRMELVEKKNKKVGNVTRVFEGVYTPACTGKQ
ncbi:Hypothetical_protein [Hexamita inflata]|uniref:Hypothetical_protein n=1 Tax=Hexamita inflata TaxID=28002 RepID=A0AA86U4E0_9EUKA|nr:Hypothetical protein HINF_LOCUS26776 [Hexamita inflata]